MKSTVFTRWGLPLALIGSALLLSAYVYFVKLPEPARALTERTAATFGGAPAVALVLLLVLRVAARLVGGTDRGTDLVIVWVLTFLFSVHAAVLAATIGMISSLKVVVPYVVGLLLLGLGPTIAALGPASPLGIRTPSTLADPGLWRRTHRLAGWLLALAGIAGLVGAQIGGPWALVAGVGPAVIALIVALAYASQPVRPVEAGEENDDHARLPEESPVDATDS